MGLAQGFPLVFADKLVHADFAVCQGFLLRGRSDPIMSKRSQERKRYLGKEES